MNPNAYWIWPAKTLYLQNCYAGFRHDFNMEKLPPRRSTSPLTRATGSMSTDAISAVVPSAAIRTTGRTTASSSSRI